MSKFDSIRKHINNKMVVHLSMTAFAVTSTLNVAGFFAATDHHWAVAGSIGLALGAGLMAVSIYLSNQDMRNRGGFLMLLAAALAMALLSGQIQAMAYQMHGLDTFTAYLLGYCPPMVAEVLLALSVSLAERNEAERVRRDSKGHIQNAVSGAMVTAFKDIDATRIQRHIDKQVDAVIKAFCDDALNEMMAELRSHSGNGGTASALPTTVETAESKEIAESDRASVAEMNAERQRQIADRRAGILHLFSTYGEMLATDLQTRLADDLAVTVAERTLRSDLQSLVDGGELAKVGRGKWTLPHAIAATVPTMTEPATNGYHK